MTVDIKEIKQVIERSLPGSKANIRLKTADGEHVMIDVAYPGFKGKSLVEQHKLVHEALKKAESKMHAVIIKTVVNQEELPARKEESMEEKDKIKEMIRKSIAHNDIAIFIKGTPSRPLCGFSARVVMILNELGVKYQAVNIFDDISIKPKLSEMTGWPTTPQVFIKGKLIGGCDITEEMYMSGELQKMLKEAKILA